MNLKLKFRILEKHRSQVEFAQKYGLTEDRLSRIIHERIKPSQEDIRIIAEALDCETGEIFEDGGNHGRS